MPIELVFDVLTKPEHVRKTIAPYGEEVKVCSIDLRVGGNYHVVFVTDDGSEMSANRGGHRAGPVRQQMLADRSWHQLMT
jgi:uncharacterized protein YndB with AHSA1/START domain